MTSGLTLPSPSKATLLLLLLLQELVLHSGASDPPFSKASAPLGWLAPRLQHRDIDQLLARSPLLERKTRNPPEDTTSRIATENSGFIGLSSQKLAKGYHNATSSLGKTRDYDVIRKSSKPKHWSRRRRRAVRRMRNRMREDLSLWIDENQVKSFGGYNTEIFVILNGRILPYVLHPNFEDHLPVIPSEVEKVTFMWKSGRKKRYYYNFYILSSSDENILQIPMVTIRKRGKIPKKAKAFSIMIPCVENASGVASFHIGLVIKTKRRKTLPGTPLSLMLKKKCERVESLIISAQPDSECDKKCSNGGVCDKEKLCRCAEGYMGQFCDSALCYPQCQNGGTCSAPGKCTCQAGYHGRFCEGGICKESCLNGGRCIQKDTCACRGGFFGNRCEFNKCVIPCVNGGKCRGANKCKCKPGFAGNHCEIIDQGLSERLAGRCKSKCRFGSCLPHGRCHCDVGYSGRWCRRKGKPRRKKLWI